MRLLLTISALFLIGTSSAQKTIDKIVAQVGENIILLSDIQAQKLQIIQSGTTVTNETDCTILEQLMYQNLLINQAKLDSLEVSEEQVEAEMESNLRQIDAQMGGRDKLEAFYGQTTAEIKNEFRPVFRDKLLAREMEWTITEGIDVSPKEVNDFYSKLPADSLPFINAQMSFQQIVIYPEVSVDDKKRAFDQLQEIRTEIVENGKSFSTQARIHSMDPGSSGQGGEIKASKGMMVKPFEAAVFNLKEGEVSAVFESEYGYHIVKLLDRKGDDYTCQHILITPEFSNTALDEAAQRMDSCYNRLKSGEISWEEAVLEYSNDEATRQNQGTISNPITGSQMWSSEDLNQIDQQIYLLTDNMEKGSISQANFYTNVIERKQGVRIVRLTDRTKPHRANLTDDYGLIKNAAINEKKQLVINEWIVKRAGTTFIQINEPHTSCTFSEPWRNH